MTTWTAVGAIGALIIAMVAVWQLIYVRQRTKVSRVFVSMQMSDLSDDGYFEMQSYLLGVVGDLRKSYMVHFYNESIRDRSLFREESFDSEAYMDGIHSCDVFVAVISAKVVSSVYFEVGYAMALNKKVILFAGPETRPPMLIRKAAKLLPDIKMIHWSNIQDIGPELKQALTVVSARRRA